MNTSRQPLGDIRNWEGKKPRSPFRTRSINMGQGIGLKRSLTMGPGLPDPQGLHWLLTGEFLFAAETGVADYTS